MKTDQIGMLWESRFRKIFEMERESLDFYRDLSKKDELIGESPRLREILEEIIEDEERHSLICKELLKIIKRKKSRGENPQEPE